MYDYDFDKKGIFESENMLVYGEKVPPIYPLNDLKNLPILLVCGKTDRLCQPGDYLNLYA